MFKTSGFEFFVRYKKSSLLLKMRLYGIYEQINYFLMIFN